MDAADSGLDVFLAALRLGYSSLDKEVRCICHRIADKICTHVKMEWVSGLQISLNFRTQLPLICIKALSLLLLQMKMSPLFDYVVSCRCLISE